MRACARNIIFKCHIVSAERMDAKLSYAFVDKITDNRRKLLPSRRIVASCKCNARAEKGQEGAEGKENGEFALKQSSRRWCAQISRGDTFFGLTLSERMPPYSRHHKYSKRIECRHRGGKNKNNSRLLLEL